MGMASETFEELKVFVGFGSQDAANLRALAGPAALLLPEVVGRFYDVIFSNPQARNVLRGGDEQVERLRETLTKWLVGLFGGVYDSAYLESRFQIGVTHVRVGLPQKYMPLAMEVVRRSLVDGLRTQSIPDLDEKLRSLHKLLTIDLTVMLESYQQIRWEQIRELERTAVAAKLSRAEHLAEIGQLAASLAHEIKNPLAGISGAIQVIGDSLEAESPYRSVVHDILGQISRMDATVKDLLLYARPTPPQPSVCAVARLVPRVLSLLQEEPSLRKVQVEFHNSHPDATLYADEGQLEQLLMNLIINAAHATADGGSIHVEAVCRGDRTLLIIRDHGIGMPPDVQAKALDPFFTTKAKGTGLGLAICRRIADSNGGSISLESEPNKGTVVTVDLPRHVNGHQTRDT